MEYAESSRNQILRLTGGTYEEEQILYLCYFGVNPWVLFCVCLCLSPFPSPSLFLSLSQPPALPHLSVSVYTHMCACLIVHEAVRGELLLSFLRHLPLCALSFLFVCSFAFDFVFSILFLKKHFVSLA